VDADAGNEGVDSLWDDTASNSQAKRESEPLAAVGASGGRLFPGLGG